MCRQHRCSLCDTGIDRNYDLLATVYMTMAAAMSTALHLAWSVFPSTTCQGIGHSSSVGPNIWRLHFTTSSAASLRTNIERSYSWQWPWIWFHGCHLHVTSNVCVKVYLGREEVKEEEVCQCPVAQGSKGWGVSDFKTVGQKNLWYDRRRQMCLHGWWFTCS